MYKYDIHVHIFSTKYIVVKYMYMLHVHVHVCMQYYMYVRTYMVANSEGHTPHSSRAAGARDNVIRTRCLVHVHCRVMPLLAARL